MIRHIERIGNDRTGEMVYVGECGKSLSKSAKEKVNDCSEKRSMGVKQARIVVHDRRD